MSLFFFSACRQSHDTEVDKLNDLSYSFHYKDLDSTYRFASEAYRLSEHYPDGRAEALNNLAFVNIARMNYAEAALLLDSVQMLTDNQIERLIGNIQQMRLCQRKSRNKDFYDYQEKAIRALRRINEERSILSTRLQKRMIYAESEFNIVTSTYYYYVGQLQASAEAIDHISADGEILRDTAQYLNYLYQIGAGGIISEGTKEDINQHEWDYLMRCYLLAKQSSNIYWEANALQAMSEHMFEPVSRDRLIADNLPAMKYVNIDSMPDTLLAGYLAQKSLGMFAYYGDVYQIAGSYRTLAQCYWAIGDFRSSIICLEEALHHDEAILQAPDLVASIRERLSLTYSAIDDKEKSDYNRSIYLDMQSKTRQDSQLEARAEQLGRASSQLNLMILSVVMMIVIVAVSLIFFDYLRRRKDRNNPLAALSLPLEEWQQSNESYLTSLAEREEEIDEAYTLSQINIGKNKRRNVENRAKVFLVNSITPLIDRILNQVRRLRATTESDSVRHERLEYITEITDKIDEYNHVLTEWIQLQQGQLSLHIESFPVQELFDMLKRSRMSFRMKGIDLQVKPTDAVVKADRILTLFMINTIADNARKFTPEGGQVVISAAEVMSESSAPPQPCVEISVSDTGVGIAESELSGIFGHKVHGGHGFGLMNCKGIIEKYRKVSRIFSVCDIKAESKVGQGSKFSFRLPKGVLRLLLFLFLCGPLQAESLSASPAHSSAAAFADSAHACNATHRYHQSIIFADSALQSVNASVKASIPDSLRLLLIDDSAHEPVDVVWYRDSIPTDYNLLLFLRNEIAVAALACHDWSLYTYNNKVYTQLYKELTADHTLSQYVKAMQRSKVNKNIAIFLLFLLLVSIVVAYYMLYYRHRLYYRFCLERVEQINEMLLSDKTDEEKLRRLNQQLADVGRFPTDLQSIVEKIRKALQQSVDTSATQRLSIEMAEDECRRAEYENQKLYVSNNVLDNCLSTLKHETMYYPSRIRQLVDDLNSHPGEQMGEQMQAIDEIVTYYKDLYALLSAQAMRQVESIRHECGPVSVEGVTVLGEESMIHYLFEILQRQSGESSLLVNASIPEPHYALFTIDMPKLPWREFFEPSMKNIPFLICRQIVRENSEQTNRRGCGIVAERLEQGGTRFRVTLANRA